MVDIPYDVEPYMYPWERAPEWAQFAATDLIGDRTWFEQPPVLNERRQFWHAGDTVPTRSMQAAINDWCDDWRDSLRRRPEIDARELEWIAIGKALRDKRTQRMETTSQMERRTGLPASQISAMEMGRVEPQPALLGIGDTP